MDYLNGLQSHSITDMLPDQPLVQPCEDTYTRGGKVVRVGYYNYICANPECGKAFEATQQHMASFQVPARMERMTNS